MSTQSVTNAGAQRKVAHSLLAMACNDSMADYFIHKGGGQKVRRVTFRPGLEQLIAERGEMAFNVYRPPSIVPTEAPETIISGLPLRGDHPMHPFVIDAVKPEEKRITLKFKK